MTEDELKKEAEEYVKNNYCETCVMAEDCEQGCIDCYTVRAYIDSAESREKKIEELEKKITTLRQDWDVMKSTITDYEKENTELKARISEQSERITELTQELDDKINRFG